MKPSILQDHETNQNSDTTRTKPSSKTKQHEIHQTQHQQQQHQQQALNCPRCDSTNTKFCYYNNYSLTQPRHFCKTCRRYWTKGGALRNVPVGGGCRKTKKLKSSSSSSSALRDPPAFEFLTGISPSIDFQLNGGLGVGSSNYSFMGVNNFAPIHHTIESLSSLNQDLHWKLQQQRLAMIYGNNNEVQNKVQNQKLLQPILFHNLEGPKQDGNNCLNNDHDDHPRNESTTTEWFFGNSSSNIGGGSSGWNNNTNNGVQAWGDLHHFTALP